MSNKQSFNVCFCFRRKFRLRMAEPPEDIKNVFYLYAQNGTMTIDDLQKFLIEFQGESSATKEDAQAIFNSLKHLHIFQRKELDLDAFFRYLLGDLNPPLSSKVHHDMNSPLAHYFLFTGHNSYLKGNQLSSNSSVRPIINALRQGVRVIELDLWQGSKKNDVVVRHGGTLTSPVDLIKCLRAIKENAFVASEYPVVITFEDHLHSNLQARVATMLTETFGDMLYSPDSEFLKEFPSPASLKRRILISTKPPKYPESQKPGDQSGSTDHKENEQDDEEDEDKDEENAIPEYKQLIAIHAGKPKRGLDKWHIDPNKVRRLSLNEQQLKNETRTRGSDIVRFTQRNLLRVYPKGTRLNSSNYNPMLAWTYGAQMVAFNMQGHGKHLWIMEGMFRANGGCGYVKKPEFLLASPNNEVFDPNASLPVKKTLKVKVYMGDGWRLDFHRTHFDLCSPPDFYVRVGIAGVPSDKTKMMETEPIEDQWVPVWNKEFTFPLRVPELAVLRVKVNEYDTPARHDFGGQTCLPIRELRTGIRAVPLHSERGQKYTSVRLLMRFELTNEV
ncbi:phosphoinositide phospholipase C 2-like isoform X2 [Pyrus x bretschneideri]|uniref:phosphoinositide phospholipase C 2-like isoform X2 n=1 Tax=Pyrus x bretschneideri TaxID=225117 RepID=UPI002030A391|nr:phosphoinositide phospholipase C 2-like isoform X2 [Pyrus x bretschneideri]